jgi:mersacidin/lichenicidin family type 2 lantibiotic
MSRSNIIRAWKDEEYRRSLSEAESEIMPPNPAGVTELSDDQLKKAAGGTFSQFGCTVFFCPSWTCRPVHT